MPELRFKDYAHDNYEDSETVEHLVETFGWDEDIAERYVRSHKPLHEVEAEFVYDPDTDKLAVVSAIINGTKLVPAQ